ncbi:MAG: hypothetical protein GXP26_05025 [Planctomycetes bacterium]|nr:hypothetical protein [Planctomycetota bacterium]
MSVLEANGAIRFAKIDASTSGDNTLVAAVSGKQLRLLGLVLVASGAVSVQLKSGSTEISGPMALATNGILEGHAGWGLMETVAGEALVLNLSGAVAVGGWLTFQELR